MPLQADDFGGTTPTDLLTDPLVLAEALGACSEVCSAYGTIFRPEAHCHSVLEHLRGNREVADLLGRMRRSALDSDPGGLAQALDVFHDLVVRHCHQEVLQIIAGEVPCEGVLPTFDSAEWWRPAAARPGRPGTDAASQSTMFVTSPVIRRPPWAATHVSSKQVGLILDTIAKDPRPVIGKEEEMNDSDRESQLLDGLRKAPTLLVERQRCPSQYTAPLEMQEELHGEPGRRISSRPALPPEAEGDGVPPPRRPSPPGYEILRELGQGSMGVVHLAHQVQPDRLVALKMIRAGHLATPEERQRFQAESDAVAQIPHPNVVQVFDVGESDGLLYMAMEYIEGGSLAARLGGSPMAPRPAAILVQSLARGIHAAHRRGIIHRDLKPDNVLLTADGLPIITDFGLAKTLYVDSHLTVKGALMGTSAYMAPEQALGKEVSPAVDIHALGAILYVLLTGRPPFRAEPLPDLLEQIRSHTPTPPRQVRPEIPADLDAICRSCLHKDPAGRPLSAEALAEDLGRFLEFVPSAC